MTSEPDFPALGELVGQPISKVALSVGSLMTLDLGAVCKTVSAAGQRPPCF